MAFPTHGLFLKEPFRTVQYRVHAMDSSAFARSFDMEFERGPDNASHAFFESTAWYYLRAPQTADSMRLSPAYRRTPADPRLDPDAVKYDHISYDDVLAQHLAVMDTTATSLSMDNHLPIVLFALEDPENIYRVVMGEDVGTTVKEDI